MSVDYDQDLDAQLVQRCNELMAMKQETARKRSEYFHKTTQLLHQLDDAVSAWKRRLKVPDETNDAQFIYQNAFNEVFADTESGETPQPRNKYTAKKQTELCRTIHRMFLYENQMRLFAHQTKELVEVLEDELDKMYDHDDDVIRNLRSQIVDLEVDFSQHNDALRSECESGDVKIHRLADGDETEVSLALDDLRQVSWSCPFAPSLPSRDANSHSMYLT